MPQEKFAKNSNGNEIWIRKCSDPDEKIKELYHALNYKFYPFIRRKFVVLKTEPENQKATDLQVFRDG